MCRPLRLQGSPYVGDNLKDYRAQSPITYAAQYENAHSHHARYRRRPRDNYARVLALPRSQKTTAGPSSSSLSLSRGISQGTLHARMDVYRHWVEWMDQY